MGKLKTKEINGIKVESYELSDEQFDAACALVEHGVSAFDFDRLEDATPFMEEWVNSPHFDKGYREWLRKCIDDDAEIFTYKEDWQSIGEIAVYR